MPWRDMVSLNGKCLMLYRHFSRKALQNFQAPSNELCKLRLHNSCHKVIRLWPREISYAGFGAFPARFYRSTNTHRKSKEKKEPNSNQSENIDDLKSLLQNKSLSFTAKFKVLFQQYGLVLVVVHCITAAFWFGLFYYAVSRGFDIVPLLEKHGVFDFLETIGLPASDKLKSPGASNALAAYLLYEVAKPIRYPVTIVGTIYAVRFLRRLGHLKRPPATDTTVRELVQTQGKIVQHQIKHTASKYQARYRASTLRRAGKLKTNGTHRKTPKKKQS